MLTHVEDAEQRDEEHNRGEEHQAVKAHAVYKATADTLAQSLAKAKHDRVQTHDGTSFAGDSFGDGAHLREGNGRESAEQEESEEERRRADQEKQSSVHRTPDCCTGSPPGRRPAPAAPPGHSGSDRAGAGRT